TPPTTARLSPKTEATLRAIASVEKSSDSAAKLKEKAPITRVPRSASNMKLGPHASPTACAAKIALAAHNKTTANAAKPRRSSGFTSGRASRTTPKLSSAAEPPIHGRMGTASRGHVESGLPKTASAVPTTEQTTPHHPA